MTDRPQLLEVGISQGLQEDNEVQQQLYLDGGNANQWARLPRCLTCLQDPIRTVDKEDIGEVIAPLCLDKIKSVPMFLPRKTSHLLGLTAEN